MKKLILLGLLSVSSLTGCSEKKESSDVADNSVNTVLTSWSWPKSEESTSTDESTAINEGQ